MEASQPMMTLIQDTLALWRDAERALDHLAPTSPDHETVSRIVLELQATYTRLTRAGEWSQADLASCRDAVESARQLLRRVASGMMDGAVPEG